MFTPRLRVIRHFFSHVALSGWKHPHHIHEVQPDQLAKCGSAVQIFLFLCSVHSYSTSPRLFSADIQPIVDILDTIQLTSLVEPSQK